MVIKVYISGISASKEVKKRQQRALLILDSLKVDYKAIDITEPGNEEERDYFKENCKKRDPEPIPHPPQFFNDNKYCGDWEDFFTASDDDTVLSFLGIEESKTQGETLMTNGTTNNSVGQEESTERHEGDDEQMNEETHLPDEGISVDVSQIPQGMSESPLMTEDVKEEEIEVLATTTEDSQSPTNIDAAETPELSSDLITDVDELIVEKEDHEDEEEQEEEE